MIHRQAPLRVKQVTVGRDSLHGKPGLFITGDGSVGVANAGGDHADTPYEQTT